MSELSYRTTAFISNQHLPRRRYRSPADCAWFFRLSLKKIRLPATPEGSSGLVLFVHHKHVVQQFGIEVEIHSTSPSSMRLDAFPQASRRWSLIADTGSSGTVRQCTVAYAAQQVEKASTATSTICRHCGSSRCSLCGRHGSFLPLM